MCLSPSTDPESEERPITGQPWGRGDLLGCAPHFGVSPGPGWKKRGSAHYRYPKSHGALHRSLSQGPFFEFFRQLLYWFIHILFLQTVREIVLLFYQKKKTGQEEECAQRLCCDSRTTGSDALQHLQQNAHQYQHGKMTLEYWLTEAYNLPLNVLGVRAKVVKSFENSEILDLF